MFDNLLTLLDDASITLAESPQVGGWVDLAPSVPAGQAAPGAVQPLSFIAVLEWVAATPSVTILLEFGNDGATANGNAYELPAMAVTTGNRVAVRRINVADPDRFVRETVTIVGAASEVGLFIAPSLGGDYNLD